eukprot:SAG11_NODE_720_length_7550_cov_12.284257_1_plen_34_part_10
MLTWRQLALRAVKHKPKSLQTAGDQGGVLRAFGS